MSNLITFFQSQLDWELNEFLTCNESPKYCRPSYRCVGLSSRNTCYHVLRATERWTALYHFTCKDVDDYWSLRSHRRRQERGPRSQKVGCGLGDYRGSRATSAGRRASSVLRGLTQQTPFKYCFGSIETSTVSHFDRTSDVISHNWIPQQTRTHTLPRFKSAVSVKGKSRLSNPTYECGKTYWTVLQLSGLNYNVMGKSNYEAKGLFCCVCHISPILNCSLNAALLRLSRKTIPNNGDSEQIRQGITHTCNIWIFTHSTGKTNHNGPESRNTNLLYTYSGILVRWVTSGKTLFSPAELPDRFWCIYSLLSNRDFPQR